MNCQYNILGIITARGGSKGIKDKNIVDFGGRPLISYSINALKEAGFIDRIVCTTDSKKIANVARQYGAETPFLRPKKLAEDTTSTIPVITHALEWLAKNEGYKPDYVVLMQPTEPFVKPEHIRDVLQLMIEKKADSGITMVPLPRTNHPYHVRRLTNNGYLEFDNEELHYAHPYRQLDPKRYAFGNLYLFKRDAFLKEQKVEVGKRVGVEIDPVSAHDINNQIDLEIARVLLERMKKK